MEVLWQTVVRTAVVGGTEMEAEAETPAMDERW